MNNLLGDFVAYFAGVDNTLVAGTNLFYETMPSSPDGVVSIYERPGPPLIPQISGASRRIQVQVRNKKTTVAKPLADKLFKSLLSDTGIIQLTEQRWCTISPQGTPTILKVDENKCVYYNFTVVCTTYID